MKGVSKIKIKQIEDPIQPEPKTDQKVDSDQSEEVVPNENNVPDSIVREADPSNKRKLLIRIWEFFLQNLVGIGTFLGGFAAFLAVIFKIILPNTIQVEGKIINSEKFGELVEANKHEKSAEVSELLQEVVQDPRSSSLDKAIVNAYMLQQTGEIKKAITKWRSIANVFEGTDSKSAAVAWFLAGSLLLQHGRYEEAISDFSKSLELKPDYVKAYYDRGDANLRIGELKEAIDDFGKVLEIDPDYVEAYYSRGFANLILSKYEDAKGDFRKALDLKPDYTKAKWRLQETESYLRSTKVLNPNTANAEEYYMLGIVKFNKSAFKEAIGDFDKALKLNPDYIEAYYSRGAAKFNIEQYQSAIADYNKVILLNPEFSGAYVNRGEAKSKLRQYESAITDYNKAIQLDPNYAYAYYVRADVKFHIGDIAGEESDLKTALKMAEKINDEKLKGDIELRILGLTQ